MEQHRRPPAEVGHKPTDTTTREPEVVRIGLLGGFRVSVGPRTVEESAWRLRKAASLVKLLALARGHRLHRERVMDLLWPDLNKKAASNNLRQALHVARRALEPDPSTASRCVELQDEQLSLCPGGQLWVDVDAFEESAQTARRSREPAAYRAAIELYAGELLPGDPYEEWAEGRREALRQLYLALLIELAALHGERGEHEPAIEALRRVVSEEPIREEAHASLMRLHALSGQRQEAILQYERLRKSLSEIDAEPGPESRRLYEEIRAGSFALAPSPSTGRPSEGFADPTRHNLPASLTSFVGRESEMVEARRLLSMTRLLTLAGAGGSGKTRLALEVGRSLVGAFPDGVWIVELAGLSEPDLVPQAVATALEVREQPGHSLLDTLLDALRDKEMLLVLDNCEHLIGASARLAEALLHSCPRLRVLATSREPLGIRGEVLWQVSPLSLPDTTDEGSAVESFVRYEAVRLFVDRARLRLPDFKLTRENAGAVARVCRKLDGIPLAIELACARMGTLAVEQVAQRLEDSLDLLAGGSRTAVPRQQTLRATLDWSHDLLSDAERTLLRRLSVFAGGWTLEAAEAVCSGDGIEQNGVLNLLGELVYKSLVVAGAPTGGAVRYRMLEPIRQYALEKLGESGEADEVKGRHAAFFLTLAEEAEPELDGPQQRMWVERLEGEHDNLREALSWDLEGGKVELGLRFGGALWRFWFAQGYLSEGLRWLDEVLAGSDRSASPVRVKALEGIGWLAQGHGDFERAESAYDEMLKLSRELGNKGDIATALNSLGTVAAQQGDYTRAKALLEENLAVLRELEYEGNTATTLKRYHVFNLLGALAMYQEGDHARASELFEESLALARESGDAFRIGVSLTGLGYLALLQGDHERATALCEESLALAHDLGSAGVENIPENLVNLGLAALTRDDHERAMTSFEEALLMSQNLGRKQTVVNTLEGMASLAGACGEATRAARLWGAAEVSREVISVVLAPGERALYEPYLAAARSEIGDAAWEEALSEGRAMSLEETAEYALSREKPDPATTPVPEEPAAGEPMSKLTPREEEVAVLVARGFTNRQIASQLTLSEHTAATHVRNILKKLGLRSRTQIAARFTEHEPLP